MLQILKIFKILNSDSNPSAIALAICLGLVVGVTPLYSPHNLLVLLIVLLFRIHFGTFILASLGFSLVGLLLEPQLDRFGYYLLTQSEMTGFWTHLYNTRIGRLSLFNYTTQLGGLAVALICFIPIWLVSVWGINNYRTHLMTWVLQSKIVTLVRSSNLYTLYDKTSGDNL